MSTAFFLLMQLAIIAYALVGGVFLAFSDFIMRSLALTGGHGGVEAMQVINREVFRWVFMALFLGMAAVSLVVAGYGAFGVSGPAGTLIMMAGLVYLIGTFAVTVFFNVPMNEALAGMEMSSGATRDYWLQTYVPRWTFWNSVRTFASAASAALLLFGLVWMTQSQSQSV
ncbi:anthrone oxygenase family protein [Gymnodinialimonas sp.]